MLDGVLHIIFQTKKLHFLLIFYLFTIFNQSRTHSLHLTASSASMNIIEHHKLPLQIAFHQIKAHLQLRPQ